MSISLIHVRLFILITPTLQSFPCLSEEKLVDIINVMTAHPDEPLRSGRIECWAAAIVYLALQENRLSNSSCKKDISGYFRIAVSTLTTKSNYIRRLMQRSSG